MVAVEKPNAGKPATRSQSKSPIKNQPQQCFIEPFKESDGEKEQKRSPRRNVRRIAPATKQHPKSLIQTIKERVGEKEQKRSPRRNYRFHVKSSPVKVCIYFIKKNI